MRAQIRNCLATTGLSLILLALVATLNHARFLFVASVYQTLLANILIHLGLSQLKRFESKYYLVEILVEIGYVLAVLIIAGALFGWYSSTPIWMLVIMGILVYFIGGMIQVFYMKSDIELINGQLIKRREQNLRRHNP